MKEVNIIGVRIDILTLRESVTAVLQFLQEPAPHMIVTVNPEFIVTAVRAPHFKQILASAHLALPDGIGILWAARCLQQTPRWAFQYPHKYRRWMLLSWYWFKNLFTILLQPSRTRSVIPERVTGVDCVLSLCQQLTVEDRLYLVGGKGDTAILTAKVLRDRYPNLNIVGAEEGIHQCEVRNDQLYVNAQENDALVERIRQARSTIVLVAFGHQRQEYWIDQYGRTISGVRVLMGVGGTFDFIAGRSVRAPRVIQFLGLEWLWRLLLQPWRWRRIIDATIVFPWMVWRWVERTAYVPPPSQTRDIT